MVLAEREDGQRLLALNEIFVGHRSHQSARYLIRTREGEEHQSSSGVLCASGTGSTGWARSVARQRGLEARLPGAEACDVGWVDDKGGLGGRVCLAKETPECRPRPRPAYQRKSG